MGPSGCGKTTLLNVLARRDAATGAKVEGTSLINGNDASKSTFREITSYIEQEDALIGKIGDSPAIPITSIHETCLVTPELFYSQVTPE